MCHFVKNCSTLGCNLAVGVKCLPLDAEGLGSIPGVWPIENCAASEFQGSKKKNPKDENCSLFRSWCFTCWTFTTSSWRSTPRPTSSSTAASGKSSGDTSEKFSGSETNQTSFKSSFDRDKNIGAIAEHLIQDWHLSERFVNIGRQECTGVDDVTMYWVVMEIIVIPGHLSVCFGQLHIWED